MNEYDPKNLEEAKEATKPPPHPRLDEGFVDAPPHLEADPLDPVAPSDKND